MHNFLFFSKRTLLLLLFIIILIIIMTRTHILPPDEEVHSIYSVYTTHAAQTHLTNTLTIPNQFLQAKVFFHSLVLWKSIKG